jgi:hypothetical protein
LSASPPHQHARSENGVGLAQAERLGERAENPRSVLAVAAQQRYEVEMLVDRVVEHGHLERNFRIAANPDPLGEGRVLGTVVDDQNLDIISFEQLRRYATHHFLDGTLGEISDNEDKQSWLR